MVRCVFCCEEATGSTTLDDKWRLDTCADLNCKRKKTIIFKLLVGDLSNDTVLRMARIIPSKELCFEKVNKDFSKVKIMQR